MCTIEERGSEDAGPQEKQVEMLAGLNDGLTLR